MSRSGLVLVHGKNLKMPKKKTEKELEELADYILNRKRIVDRYMPLAVADSRGNNKIARLLKDLPE